MNNLFYKFKTISQWIWVGVLAVSSFCIWFLVKPSVFKLNIIGAVIIALYVLRLILRHYGILRRGNPYVYSSLLTFAFSAPLVYEYSVNHIEKQNSVLLLYFLVLGSLIYWFMKTGKFGAKIQKNLKDYDENGKYCKFCGERFNSIDQLVRNKCMSGDNYRNYHMLYEGDFKSRYTCKHCGETAKTLKHLCSNKCTIGGNKGRHHTPLN